VDFQPCRRIRESCFSNQKISRWFGDLIDEKWAVKARGVVLGNPKLADVRDRAVASVKADADPSARNNLRSISTEIVVADSAICSARRYLTLRLAADSLPRLLSISYSMVCPSLSERSPARSTAEM
jgi:hypothetical protein